jgi:hypothetical protein
MAVRGAGDEVADTRGPFRASTPAAAAAARYRQCAARAPA